MPISLANLWLPLSSNKGLIGCHKLGCTSQTCTEVQQTATSDAMGKKQHWHGTTLQVYSHDRGHGGYAVRIKTHLTTRTLNYTSVTYTRQISVL